MNNEKMLGGWKQFDEEINDQLEEMFETAFKELNEMKLTPVKLIGSQLVAGMNYRFLCLSKDEKKTPNFVTIYRNLQGQCQIIDISDQK